MLRHITWFMNHLIGRFCGRMRRPTYLDIEKTYPQLHELTRNSSVIREEFEGVLARGLRLPTQRELRAGARAAMVREDPLDEPEGNWTMFGLYVFGQKPERNRALCPETCRLLDRIPNLMSAGFSILDPGRSITLHMGPYLGYLRYHLGLRIPKDDPPVLVVNSQPYTWKEGEAILFDDSWPHEVINHSTDLRAVLIVDVLRPLPPLPHLVNKAVLFGLYGRGHGAEIMRRMEGSGSAVAISAE